MRNSDQPGHPLKSFTVFNSIAVVIGIVVGIGIFRLPPVVAANSAGEMQFLLFWLAGGVISIMGALCYAELSSSMPDAGGEYFFLRKAYGPATGFLLSWGRMTVIQTGSIALVAFILGDFASLLFDLGRYSSSIYAGLTVILLTGLNILGTFHSRKTQNILALLVVLTIVFIAVAGLARYPVSGSGLTGVISGSGMFSGGAAGSAMIFVLLTYGGWSEAAYLTGELHNVKRNIVKALIIGILSITTIYMLVNLAYLHVLGFDLLRESQTVGYDLAERVLGAGASSFVVVIVLLSALSTANATILTGARTNYAIGRDFRLFGFMGRWNSKRNTPVNALVVQGSIALILVFIGAYSKQAVETMVDYTAPVFWFFILSTTITVFIFRYRGNAPKDSYRVPLYPLPPLLFIAASLYMLYSSLIFTGTGAIIGVMVLIVGIPAYYLGRK